MVKATTCHVEVHSPLSVFGYRRNKGFSYPRVKINIVEILETEKGSGAMAERLTASPDMHGSRVRTPLILCGFTVKCSCFSLLNLTRGSRKLNGGDVELRLKPVYRRVAFECCSETSRYINGSM